MKSKRKKISGPSGLELSIALQSLQSLAKTLIVEGETEETDTDEKGDQFLEHLTGLMHLMESRLAELQSFTYSNVNGDILKTALLVEQDGFIQLRRQDMPALLASTAKLGAQDVWSSPTMYRHLQRLEMLVPRQNEAGARAWIDTFFFRASAMIQDDRQMVLAMKQPILSKHHSQNISSISGCVDYTAVVATPPLAATLLAGVQITNVHRLSSGFFVVEAKQSALTDYIPQAVTEIYGCAKILNKNILRGALTDGRSWIFIIVYRNEDGIGGTWKQSPPVQLRIGEGEDGLPEVLSPGPDTIAGILSYWIVHSFEDISSDDWFTKD